MQKTIKKQQIGGGMTNESVWSGSTGSWSVCQVETFQGRLVVEMSVDLSNYPEPPPAPPGAQLPPPQT